MTEPSTGEIRLLDAAESCRSSQRELTAALGQIQASMVRLEQQAGEMVSAAQTFTALADRIIPGTWRGGLVAILLLCIPSVLPMLLLLLLLDRGQAIAALVR